MVSTGNGIEWNRSEENRIEHNRTQLKVVLHPEFCMRSYDPGLQAPPWRTALCSAGGRAIQESGPVSSQLWDETEAFSLSCVSHTASVGVQIF